MQQTAAAVLRWRFADHIIWNLVAGRIKRKLARGFDKWSSMAAMSGRIAALQRQHMKLEAKSNQLKGQKMALEKIRLDMHRMRMEKVCMILLSKQKQEQANKKVEEIKRAVRREKEDVVEQLKDIYYHLYQLNDLEEQAVEVAKRRGARHSKNLVKMEKAVSQWLS